MDGGLVRRSGNKLGEEYEPLAYEPGVRPELGESWREGIRTTADLDSLSYALRIRGS